MCLFNWERERPIWKEWDRGEANKSKDVYKILKEASILSFLKILYIEIYILKLNICSCAAGKIPMTNLHFGCWLEKYKRLPK